MLIQAVGVNLPPSYVCLEGPLGGERPRAQGDEMLMQRLLPAVREALDEAAVKPEEIDLIVGLALSPDHLIENRDIMAPKIGHPLQKVLGANRAHVFDLTDSSLARALYVVDTLASDQGYRNVLVVRGESSQGLEVDSESGFALADGALALLCRPTGKAAFRRGALGGDPAQEWLPLSIPLNTDIRQVGDVKGHLNLPAQPGLPEAVRAGFTRLAGGAVSLLRSSDTAPDSVDMLICSASSPIMTDAGDVLPDLRGRLYPRMANVLSKQLGLSRALPLDSQMECASFLLNLRLAASMIRQGKAEKVLVVCSEYISNLLDFTSRTSTLFADGCAVALLTRGDDDSCDLLASAEHSDATFYEVATGRWRLPENPTGEAKPRLYFSLFSDGQNKMASFVPTNVPIAMRRALEKAGLGSDDIDYFVFHQPAPFLVKAWAEGIGARPEQYQLTMGDTGVMISVSIPYTLMTGLREGKIRPGDRIVMAGAATGWGFAAQVWQLGEVLVC